MTMRVTLTTTVMGESGSLLAAGSTYTVSEAFGASLVNSGRATDTDRALTPAQTELKPYLATDPLTGAVKGLVGPDGRVYGISRGALILSGAVAGSDSGWVPISDAPERFAYQLDSGSTSTAFSVDISADGSTSIGQAFTGTWASSASAEITFPVMYSNPLAKYFRWNVLSGGPLSVSRGV